MPHLTGEERIAAKPYGDPQAYKLSPLRFIGPAPRCFARLCLLSQAMRSIQLSVAYAGMRVQNWLCSLHDAFAESCAARTASTAGPPIHAGERTRAGPGDSSVAICWLPDASTPAIDSPNYSVRDSFTPPAAWRAGPRVLAERNRARFRSVLLSRVLPYSGFLTPRRFEKLISCLET